MSGLRKELAEFVEAAKYTDPAMGWESRATLLAKEFSDVVFAVYTGLDSKDREVDLPQFKAEVAVSISAAADAFIKEPAWVVTTLKMASVGIADAIVEAAVGYSGPVELFYINEVIPRVRVLRGFCDRLIRLGEGDPVV